MNCNLAINIAFNHLKIPKLISADDLSKSTIDELSIITYLSYFCDPARAKLLKWIRKVLPQFGISNFLTDWRDGRAFVAFIEKRFPGILPQSASFEKENALQNIQIILDIVKRKLGITANFTAKKLSNGEVEELQVMTLIMRIRDGNLLSLHDEIIVSGPGITEAVIGKETYFNIDTTQAGPGQLTIHADHYDGRKVDFSLDEKQNRVFMVTYCPKFPGIITIDIQWSDIPVPHSPFTVRVSDLMMVNIIDFDHHKCEVHMNEPIELSLNTQKAGQGTLSAYLRYGTETPIPAQVIKNRSDPVTKLRYIPPKSGQAVLHIFWSGEELKHLTITYTILDTESYRVASRPENRIYRTLEDITFSIQTRGDSLNALHLTAIMEGDDVQVPIRFNNIDRDIGHAIFRPTLPGTYRIEAACIDQLVQGSPFKVKVVDPSQCKLLGNIPKFLQMNLPYVFEVDVKHAGSGVLTFECDESQDATAFKVNSSPPDQSGVSKVEVTPQKEGQYLVAFKFQGTEIPSCPFRVHICDVSRCHISGEILEKRSTVVSKPIRFQVAVDPVDGLKPTIKATGPSAKYTPEIRKTDQNIYTVQFIPWEIGTHDISVLYGEFHVPNSPVLVSVTGFDSATCSATGSGLQQAFTGIPAQFVVLAKQEGLLKDSMLQIRVQGVLNGVECQVRARDNRNGSYNVAYLVHNPGAYLITILARDKPIPGSPFRLTALQGPTSDMCHMYGPILQPNAVLTIGNPMDFTVNASEAGVGELSVKAVGPGGVQARVYLAKTRKKGVHDIKLDPIRHGKYRVSVKWSDKHVPGSPFIIKIYPGADATKCKAHGPGLEDGFVGKPSMFTIETRDAGAGTLKVRLHGVRNAFKIEIKPIDQRDVRTLQAHYNPRKPGDYLVTIKWSEKHIPGSPFRVRIAEDGSITYDNSNQKDEQKATPRDEALNPIVEEDGDADWGDEEEEAVDQPDPSPPKQKKKRKRLRKTSNQKEAATPTLAPAPVPHNPSEMPRFDPASMRVNYKHAFVGGVNNQSKQKSSKTLKSSSTSEIRSTSPSVMPQTKMITFSGLHQLRKHPQPMYHVPGGDYHGQAMVQMNGRATHKGHMMRKWSSDKTSDKLKRQFR